MRADGIGTRPAARLVRPIRTPVIDSSRVLPRRLLSAFLAAAAVSFALAAPSSAQCARTFGPMGPEFRPSQTTFYDQIWSQVARGSAGWTFAWSEGNDIYARRYNLSLAPLGGQFLVNETLNQGTQDEPAICHGTTGNFLICWSERQAYDGSGMGIFGRAYDANGTPTTMEFVVNGTTWASQWRPLIAPTPAGGFVVAWSGDNDGNSYLRILSSGGGPIGGEIPVNTFVFDAQTDPAPAVNASGTIFVAFVDYSSHGGVGSGLNLWGRTFNSSGVAQQPSEYVLTTTPSNGDQRNPRVAADGLGRFIVVWEDQLADGSGYAIVARVFNSSGAPLAPEFLVNTTTAGNQHSPRVLTDALGRTLFVWQDDSAGPASSVLRGRRYNGSFNQLGPDFVIHESPASGVTRACPAADTNGSDIMIAFDGPGSPGNGVDVYARRFASTPTPQIYCSGKINSQGCMPWIDYNGSPSATSSSSFTISSTNVLNQKLGLLLYGYGSSFTPFQGAQICVAPPLKRTPTITSGGSTGTQDCSGVLAMDFNARIQSGVDAGLVPGATISARWYYRDPHDPAGFSTGLSNALRFAICP